MAEGASATSGPVLQVGCRAQGTATGARGSTERQLLHYLPAIEQGRSQRGLNHECWLSAAAARPAAATLVSWTPPPSPQSSCRPCPAPPAAGGRPLHGLPVEGRPLGPVPVQVSARRSAAQRSARGLYRDSSGLAVPSRTARGVRRLECCSPARVAPSAPPLLAAHRCAGARTAR